MSEEILKAAQEMREWFDAYVGVGFSEEQAMALCLRPIVSVGSSLPPEMSEAMTKISAMINRDLAE